VTAQQRIAQREREEWQAAILSGRDLTRELLDEVRGVGEGEGGFPTEMVTKLEETVAKLERELEEVKGKEVVVKGQEERDGAVAEARAEALLSENAALAETAAVMEAERQSYLDDIATEREAARLALEQMNRMQVGLRAAEEKVRGVRGREMGWSSGRMRKKKLDILLK
jgi:exo-beta-1,3-glucanase (GH17 family)